MDKSPKIFWLLLSLTFLETGIWADRPNGVFIHVDDMGYGDIDPFGVTDIKTSHLDRLACEGVKLTDRHAAGSVCSPTRVAFLTGRYQHRAGIAARRLDFDTRNAWIVQCRLIRIVVSIIFHHQRTAQSGIPPPFRSIRPSPRRRST